MRSSASSRRSAIRLEACSRADTSVPDNARAQSRQTASGWLPEPSALAAGRSDAVLAAVRAAAESLEGEPAAPGLVAASFTCCSGGTALATVSAELADGAGADVAAGFVGGGGDTWRPGGADGSLQPAKTPNRITVRMCFELSISHLLKWPSLAHQQAEGRDRVNHRTLGRDPGVAHHNRSRVPTTNKPRLTIAFT